MALFTWDETDLAWFAGLMEGEGHIGIHVKRRKYRKKDYPLPDFRIRNTDVGLLEAVKGIFGGSIRKVYDGGRETNLGTARKPYFEWAPRQSAIRSLARGILPYVRGEKTKNLEEVARFYENPEVMERLRHWSHPKE